MNYSFSELRDLIKSGDIFASVSFGASQYLVVKILDKKEEEFTFYGIKIALVGERWRLILEKDVYVEREQTIAPSPFKLYQEDSEYLQDLLKRVLEHDRPEDFLKV